MDVIESALAILEQCQFMYMSTYVLDELNAVFEPDEVKRLFAIHVEEWNKTSQLFRMKMIRE